MTRWCDGEAALPLSAPPCDLASPALARRRSDSYVHSSAFPAASARPGSARYCQAHGLRPVSALVKLDTISHPIDPEGHRSGPQLP